MDRETYDRERLLIEAAQADPSRFAELYESHFNRVWAFVIRRVCERAAAQDVTSEVFHKALKNLKSYEIRDVPFVAWLYRIASNAVNDHFNRTAREQSADERVVVEGEAPHDIEHIERRAS